MKKRGGTAAFFNLITVFGLIGAICVGLFAVLIFVNPGFVPNTLKPLPPIPTIPDLPPPPTFTATAVQKLPPTWTPEVALPTFTPTATQEPTLTPTPEEAITTGPVPQDRHTVDDHPLDAAWP